MVGLNDVFIVDSVVLLGVCGISRGFFLPIFLYFRGVAKILLGVAHKTVNNVVLLGVPVAPVHQKMSFPWPKRHSGTTFLL